MPFLCSFICACGIVNKSKHLHMNNWPMIIMQNSQLLVAKTTVRVGPKILRTKDLRSNSHSSFCHQKLLGQ